MTEIDPSEVIEQITPSPLAKYVLIGAAGIVAGVALGYVVAKILEEERAGHYEPGVETHGDLNGPLGVEAETEADELEGHPTIFDEQTEPTEVE